MAYYFPVIVHPYDMPWVHPRGIIGPIPWRNGPGCFFQPIGPNFLVNPMLNTPIVEQYEPNVHNRNVQNPAVQNLAVQNPIVQNLAVQNPIVQNPIVQTPNVQTPNVQNPNLQNNSVCQQDDPTITEEPPGSMNAAQDGTLALTLRDRIRVDITLDRAVRMIDLNNGIVLSLSAIDTQAAMLHPIGRVYQYRKRLEAVAYDSSNNNKYAKIWYKGISFASDLSRLSHLLAPDGITNCPFERYTNLARDFSLNVFYHESRHGPEHIEDAQAMLATSQHWVTNELSDNYIINNIHIIQQSDGQVNIIRDLCMMRIAPITKAAMLTTDKFHCNAATNSTSNFLLVRKGDNRVYFDGKIFEVCTGGCSAAFDENGALRCSKPIVPS